MFAPLRSQGSDSRSDYIREKAVAAAPPPCSPKSVYVLSNLVRWPSIEGVVCDTKAVIHLKLRIQPLCDLAFEDIEAKVTTENAVTEVFSWVTNG